MGYISTFDWVDFHYPVCIADDAQYILSLKIPRVSYANTPFCCNKLTCDLEDDLVVGMLSHKCHMGRGVRRYGFSRG
jgi:hypothetical protein